MLFSGRSNAENRTDVVSVRLQTFYVEQCNNITVMLNTGNLIKSNLVASSKKSPCASLIIKERHDSGLPWFFWSCSVGVASVYFWFVSDVF